MKQASNEKVKDFECSCGCGQRLRVVYICFKNGYVLDFGILKPRQKKPRVGVVLRSDEKHSLKEFYAFLPKVKTKHTPKGE